MIMHVPEAAISAEKVYALSRFMEITGIKVTSFRAARKRGLPVKLVGNPAYPSIAVLFAGIAPNAFAWALAISKSVWPFSASVFGKALIASAAAGDVSSFASAALSSE